MILRKGKKIYSGRVDEMVASQGFFELKTDQEDQLLAYLQKDASFGKIKREGGLITAFLTAQMSAADFNSKMFQEGIVLSHLVQRKESLEEQFLILTKNQSN